ncbi:hypothetical protein [Jeotgalibacillus proteolyticus]|uniref:hypothetical protein n=1 Tax=Jeotgalibacillus proteolyticus TaxID=2082395 RepID=UPI0010739F0D|nr:hypothetical protein [Jeotgalibacillus proteolyticus]
MAIYVARDKLIKTPLELKIQYCLRARAYVDTIIVSTNYQWYLYMDISTVNVFYYRNWTIRCKLKLSW